MAQSHKQVQCWLGLKCEGKNSNSLNQAGSELKQMLFIALGQATVMWFSGLQQIYKKIVIMSIPAKFVFSTQAPMG